MVKNESTLIQKGKIAFRLEKGTFNLSSAKILGFNR